MKIKEGILKILKEIASFMKKFTLEVCVDSVESALAAEKGGATRLELCSGLVIGGLTPSPSLFVAIRKICKIKIHVLIRPRFGDFCYSETEFQTILEDVKLFKSLGADGVVVGCLLPDGNLDIPRMKLLKEAAGKMSVTLHRAFDMCKDGILAINQCKEIGINTILTSGQRENCLEGAENLAQFVKEASSQVDILAGGGISATVIQKIQPITGLTSFHMSGKITVESKMTYRNPNVFMGLPGISEYEIWKTDSNKIADAKKVLENL